MAARIVESGVSGTRRLRAICAIAALFVLALGVWRGINILTQPVEIVPPPSVEQQNLLSVIEPLAGPGNARVTIRRSGNNVRDFLVLIDTSSGAVRPLAKEIEAMLVSAAGFNAPLGDTLTVREFPFAQGLAARPNIAELAELGVFGMLAFLLSWGAFVPANQTVETTARKTKRTTPADSAARPRPVAVELGSSTGSSAASAAKTAHDDPAGTAKIIRAWMRAPEASS